MAKRSKGSTEGESRPVQEAAVEHRDSIIEQDGAFYWLDSENETLIGPFRTRRAAVADRDSPGPIDEDLSGAPDLDAVLEAEAEIGIEDFIDPDTGEPTHGYEPHVRDDH